MTHVLGGHPGGREPELLLLFGDEVVHPVKSDPAIVADDAPAAVGIRKTGDDAGVAGRLHVRRIDVEDTLIVGLSPLREDVDHIVIHFIAIGLTGLHRHADAAEDLQGTLQRFVGLQTDDLLEVFVDVPCRVRCDGRDHARVHVEDAALFSLLLKEVEDLSPQFCCAVRGTGEEALIALVQSVVEQDEVPHIDVFLPGAGFEAVPASIVDNEIHNLTFVSPFVNEHNIFCAFQNNSTRCRHPGMSLYLILSIKTIARAIILIKSAR